jgi:hypothetical protein
MDLAQKELYETDNIIVGNGEVPALVTDDGVVWVLPGGQHTSSRFEAIKVATLLNIMIGEKFRKRTKRHFRR